MIFPKHVQSSQLSKQRKNTVNYSGSERKIGKSKEVRRTATFNPQLFIYYATGHYYLPFRTSDRTLHLNISLQKVHNWMYPKVYCW